MLHAPRAVLPQRLQVRQTGQAKNRAKRGRRRRYIKNEPARKNKPNQGRTCQTSPIPFQMLHLPLQKVQVGIHIPPHHIRRLGKDLFRFQDAIRVLHIPKTHNPEQPKKIPLPLQYTPSGIGENGTLGQEPA